MRPTPPSVSSSKAARADKTDGSTLVDYIAIFTTLVSLLAGCAGHVEPVQGSTSDAGAACRECTQKCGSLEDFSCLEQLFSCQAKYDTCKHETILACRAACDSEVNQCLETNPKDNLPCIQADDACQDVCTQESK
jgi:hypothetical protein